MAAVQVDAAVDAVSGVELGLLSAGHHVPRGQFHHVGGIALHEPFAVLVQQVGALATGGFGYQHAAARQSRWVVLDHLHVHQLGPSVVSQGHAVPSDDQGVGAGLEQAAQTAGAKDHRLGPDDEDLPGAYLNGGYSANPAVFFDKSGHEPLFVAPDSRLDQLLEHDVQHGLAGEVADKKCSGAALTAERPGAQLAFVITVEGDTEVLHVDKGLPR